MQWVLSLEREEELNATTFQTLGKEQNQRINV